MFLLDFINGLDIVQCEDFKSEYYKDDYKHNGCLNCDNKMTEHGESDLGDRSIIDYYKCNKTHVVIVIRMNWPTKIRYTYDTNGVLKYSWMNYDKELHIGVRVDIEPEKVVHMQEKCEEIVTKQCKNVILDGPPEGYD